MSKSNCTHTRPPKIENLGDGSFFYNFDVKESETESGVSEFDYNQVRCFLPVSVAKIQKCIDKEGYSHNVNLS